MERKRMTDILMMRKEMVTEIPVLDVKQSKAEEDKLFDMLINVLFGACVEKKGEKGWSGNDTLLHYI